MVYCSPVYHVFKIYVFLVLSILCLTVSLSVSISLSLSLCLCLSLFCVVVVFSFFFSLFLSPFCCPFSFVFVLFVFCCFSFFFLFSSSIPLWSPALLRSVWVGPFHDHKQWHPQVVRYVRSNYKWINLFNALSELRSCVNREVGLGSHSLSYSSPVPHKSYGFCGRKTPWKKKEEATPCCLVLRGCGGDRDPWRWGKREALPNATLSSPELLLH